jgi:hypothetical protein
MEIVAEQFREAIFSRVRNLSDDELLEVIGPPLDTYREVY